MLPGLSSAPFESATIKDNRNPIRRVLSSFGSKSGAGLVGVDLFQGNYVANTVGWADKMSHSGVYNALIHVTPALWSAILAGTSTDDHTTAFVAAASTSASFNRPLFIPGRWNIKPTNVIEIPTLIGSGPRYSKLYVDGSTYGVGKVALRNTGGTWSGVQIREATGNRTRTVLLQSAPAGSLNQVGGDAVSDFVGYANYQDVWAIGGLIALDVGNAFNSTHTSCRFQESGLGVNATPVGSGSFGLFNEMLFINCDISDNNQNVNVSPTTRSKGMIFKGGAIERCLVTPSLFQRIDGLSFEDNYLEQVAALSPMTITDCTGVYAKFDISGSNCDITLGTNTEIEIDGWQSGTCHLLGGDGTQIVTIRNSMFPNTGNAALSSLKYWRLEQTLYNGQFYVNDGSDAQLNVCPYSASVTPNLLAGNRCSITATNNTAFTINAPINRINIELFVTVRNTSGGALGVLTFDAVFKLGAAWTQPADTKSRTIHFFWNGTNYIECGRTAVDVAN